MAAICHPGLESPHLGVARRKLRVDKRLQLGNHSVRLLHVRLDSVHIHPLVDDGVLRHREREVLHVYCRWNASNEGIEVRVVDFWLQARGFRVSGWLYGLREFPRALFLSCWGQESKLVVALLHITVAGGFYGVSLGKSGVRCHD